MKKLWLIIFICILSVAFYSPGLFGADFCVQPDGSGETSLQGALDTAETNNQDDTIRVVQGIYNGNFSFSSSQGYSITLLGGCTAGCADRIVDPSNTVLDGGKANQVLNISDSSGGDITVEGFTFQNGYTANWGGGVYAASSISSGTSGNISFANNTSIGNTATGNYGGGIYINSQSNSGTAGEVTFTGNTVLRNTVQNYAGVYVRSYALDGPASNVTLTGNTIAENTATNSGGGIFAQSQGTTSSGDVTLTKNTISGNTAENFYGALRGIVNSSEGTAGDIILTNNKITDNSSDNYAGITVGSDGDTPGTVILTNNTITRNTANSTNGGVRINMQSNTNNLYNNIIWGNTASSNANIYLYGSGTANGYNNNYSGTVSWTGSGESNINVDPQFIDPDNGDFRIRSTSSCKDVGNNSAPSIPSDDFEGDSRPLDTIVDIGADEVSVVTTCVSNATELHNALIAAQSNGIGNVIMVQQGVYNRTGNFASSTSFNITLLGGYTSACSSRMINPSKTTLNGDGADSVLSISNSSGGDIAIDGFTVQNGSSPGSTDGGGLSVQSFSSSVPAGNVTIKNNIVKDN